MVNFPKRIGHLLFTELSRRDVESDAHHAVRLAAVEINPPLRCDPMRKVWPDRPHLDIVVLAAADRLRHRRVDPLAIVRVDESKNTA